MSAFGRCELLFSAVLYSPLIVLKSGFLGARGTSTSEYPVLVHPPDPGCLLSVIAELTQRAVSDCDCLLSHPHSSVD